MTTSNAPTGTNQHIFFKKGDYRRAKTVCTSYVLAALGIDKAEYHYSGTRHQMLAVARKHWSLRSVRSKLAKKASVGGSRKALQAASLADRSVVCFVVFVVGHVLLLDRAGTTIVDTAPRKRDARQLYAVYAVRQK